MIQVKKQLPSLPSFKAYAQNSLQCIIVPEKVSCNKIQKVSITTIVDAAMLLLKTIIFCQQNFTLEKLIYSS